MEKAQIRLEKDVTALVKKASEANSRSIPKEVNHVLRAHYEFEARVAEMGIKRKIK